MAIHYVVSKRVFGFDPTRTSKYLLREVITGNVPFKKVCSQVRQICGAHRGQVRLILEALVDVMTHYLSEGYVVELDEFGTFHPSIRAKASDTREEATHETIYRRRIHFKPGPLLKEMLEQATIEPLVKPQKKG